MSDTPSPARNFLRQALTGADNRTIAIGRLIGFMIALVLLFVLPLWAACAIDWAKDETARKSQTDGWHLLFEMLAIYVPAVTGSVTAVIRWTNSTEPLPTMSDAGDKPNG